MGPSTKGRPVGFVRYAFVAALVLATMTAAAPGAAAHVADDANCSEGVDGEAIGIQPSVTVECPGATCEAENVAGVVLCHAEGGEGSPECSFDGILVAQHCH